MRVAGWGVAVAWVLVVGGCGGAPPAPPTPPAAVATGAAARVPPASTRVAAPAPSEAAIAQRSHDVLLAYDRGDVATLGAELSPSFVHVEGGWVEDREELLAQLAKRKPGTPTIAKRTWEDERVIVHPDHVLFLGKATERQGGNDKHGGYKYVGRYTLQWAREGDAWKLRLWSWQRAGERAERESWNDIYRNNLGFEQQPNRLLVESVQGVRPGTALDLTMGQGRNALYLASQRWKVTGVDIADEGMRLARAEADRRKLRVQMIDADIDAWDFGTNRWDLVTMIYAGNRPKWIERVKPSVKRGGLFVLEYFAYDPDRGQSDGIKPGELAAAFAGWQIVRDDIVEDTPDWAVDHARLVRFVAKKR